MKHMVSMVLMAGLLAGCAQYESSEKEDDSTCAAMASVGMFKGRGDDVRNVLKDVGCTNVIASVDDACEHYVLVNLADGSKIRLVWDLTKSGDEPGSLKHQCRRLVQAMDAGVATRAMVWTALEYGATSRIFAEPKNGWNVYEASECIRFGDESMSQGCDLDAVIWYTEAAKRGSAIGRMKEKVASHAWSDAVAEPSPSAIDYTICSTACTMKCAGRLARVQSRLLQRYAKSPRFSIADAHKMSHAECHRFACELATIGNDTAIAYLNNRKLIDINDTTQGGILHHAAAAGNVAMVKWLIGVCGAQPAKADEDGKAPQDWVLQDLKTCDEGRRKDLEDVLVALKDMERLMRQ